MPDERILTARLSPRKEASKLGANWSESGQKRSRRFSLKSKANPWSKRSVRRAPLPTSSTGDPFSGFDVAEARDLAQLREEPRPQAHYSERRHAARQHRRNGADPGGDCAGTEVAELVRRADEKRVDRAHPAAHLVRGAELDHRRAHEHADHVGRSHDRESHGRKKKAFRDAEDR